MATFSTNLNHKIIHNTFICTIMILTCTPSSILTFPMDASSYSTLGQLDEIQQAQHQPIMYPFPYSSFGGGFSSHGGQQHNNNMNDGAAETSFPYLLFPLPNNNGYYNIPFSSGLSSANSIIKRAFWDRTSNSPSSPDRSNKNRSRKSSLENVTLQVAPGAVVCVEAEVHGDVKIGTRTIVHPCAKILATDGPIVIGESNIIEEFVIIENRNSEPLFVGSNNVFEVASKVTPKSIGDFNVFETRSVVGEGIIVGNACTFGAGTKVMAPATIEDGSVFFGDPVRHRVAADKPSAQGLQIDFLSRVLPNYHHVKITTKKVAAGQLPPTKSESSQPTTVSK